MDFLFSTDIIINTMKTITDLCPDMPRGYHDDRSLKDGYKSNTLEGKESKRHPPSSPKICKKANVLHRLFEIKRIACVLFIE